MTDPNTSGWTDLEGDADWPSVATSTVTDWDYWEDSPGSPEPPEWLRRSTRTVTSYTTTEELRDRIAEYLDGVQSLKDLRIWLMPKLWSIDRDRDRAAYATVERLARAIAEFEAGTRTLDSLRESLRSCLSGPTR